MTESYLFAVGCLSVILVGCEKGPEATATPAATLKAAPTASAAATASVAPPKTSASTPSTEAAIELVPKVSFGPIRLGASKADIEALGVLKVHPQYSGMTIPYSVYYDTAGKANRIQLTLKYAPGDVKVGSLTIPRTATFDDVKSLLTDCKDQPPATGGTTSKCREGTVNVSIGSGSPAEVWLEAALP